MTDFKIIIPSKNAQNLDACVRSIKEHEGALDPKSIIVVDDGASNQLGTYPSLHDITWIKGKKPFIFARNINIGIQEAKSDVILLNDDMTLKTTNGFAQLASIGANYGITSPIILGFVGNHNQGFVINKPLPEITIEPDVLVFICVFIPRQIIEQVGSLDERFTGYGWEDNDYCRRVRLANHKLAIYRDCVVEHGSLSPSFRTKQNITDLVEQGKKIYEDKWNS